MCLEFNDDGIVEEENVISADQTVWFPAIDCLLNSLELFTGKKM